MSSERTTARLFLGVELPPATGLALTAAAGPFLAPQASSPRARGEWRAVPAGDLHLTLVFLGAVRLDRAGLGIGELASAIAEEARAVPPVRVQLDTFGAFPTPSGTGGVEAGPARVLWAGSRRPNAELDALHRACLRASSGLGLVREEPGDHGGSVDWTPHVTVARAQDRALLPVPAGFRAAPLELGFDVVEVVVFESRLPGSEGARYVPRARIPRGPAPG